MCETFKNRALIRASVLAACVVSSALSLLQGCSTPRAPVVTGLSEHQIGVTVLPAAHDESRAMSMLVANSAIEGRLDGTLGAPERSIVDTDVTATSITDQQFSWNGRVFDSYVNVRRTFRRAAE